EVHRGHREPLLPHRRHHVCGRGRDLLGEVGALHAGTRGDLVGEAVTDGVAAEDADAHRTALAQVPGQGPGVDAADADHALRAQLVVERATAAPVGSDAAGIADDVAADPDAVGLGVLVVDAGVADLR